MKANPLGLGAHDITFQKPNPQQVEAIYAEALQIADLEKRDQHIQQACGESQELLDHVRRLFALHDQHFSSFLEQPAGGLPLGGNVPSEILNAGFAATIGKEGYSPKTKSFSGSSKSQISLRSLDGDDSKVNKANSSEIPDSKSEGRYQFVGELGRGGMGAVLKGRDTEIGRDLAIKVLLERFSEDQELLDRFIDEAQIGGQLQHPGIAPVYEMGRFEDNRPYFTMKLVKGSTLAEILAERESPKDDWPKLLPIFEQVCQTIAYAHSKGVIHRDLKPSNIMVGAFGEVQVMDWGLAKVLNVGGDADERVKAKKSDDATFIQTRRSGGDSSSGGSGSATRAGSGMGTPAYMPPEQALGEIEILDERADVFGLGAILAEILTGKPAYSGEDLISQARRGRVESCLKRLDESGADEALTSIVKKALEPEAKDRQRNAGVFSDQVTAYLEGVQDRLKEAELATVAAETRVVEEQRRRRLLLTIAGMLLALVGSAAVLAWQQYRVAKAETETRIQKAETEVAAKTIEIVELTAEANDTDITLAGIIYSQQAAQKVLNLEGVPDTRKVLARKTLTALQRHGQKLGGRRLGNGEPTYPRGVTDNNEKHWSLTVADMKFSPDSRWLAAGCRIWDMDAPDPEATMVQYSTQDLHRIFFHPSSRWLISIGKDSSNLVTDLESPTEDGFSRSSIPGLGRELDFSPNGDWLISTDRRSSTIELLDWSDTGPTGKRRSILSPYPVWSVAVSPAANWLAIDGFNSQTTLLDISQGFENPSFHEVGDQYSKQAFTADGQWFLALHKDGSVHVWSLASGKPADTADFVLSHANGAVDWIVPFRESNQVVTCGEGEPTLWDLAAEDPASSGKKLYNGGGGGFVPSICQDRWLVSHQCVWDLETAGQEDAKQILTDFDFGILSAVSSDGKWLAHGSWARPYPRIWKLDQLQFTVSPIALRSPGSEMVSFDSGGERLFTHGFYTRPLQRYDLSEQDLSVGGNGYDPCSLEIAVTATAACLSNNGDWFAEGTSDGEVSVFPMDSKPSAPRLQLQVTDGEPVHAVGISNDGQLLLVASGTQTVELWDLRSKEVIATVPVDAAFPDKPKRTILKFSNDQCWLHVLLETRQSEFFHFDGKRTIGKSFVIPADRGGRNITKICPRSRWAFSRYGKTAWLWDLDSEDPAESVVELTGLNDNQFPFVCCFSQDGSLVAAGTQTSQAVIWKIDNIEAGQKTLGPWRTFFSGTVGTIWSVAISPDNRWLACGVGSSLTYVWNTGDESPQLRDAIRLQGSPTAGHIRSLAFHPDADLALLATSAKGDLVRLWNLDLETAVQKIEEVAGFRVEPGDFESR